MEVLQECSYAFGRGKKMYQCMYTMDGKIITDLESIPADCKLLLVSEKLPLNCYEDDEPGLEKAFVTGVDPQFNPSKLHKSMDKTI